MPISGYLPPTGRDDDVVLTSRPQKLRENREKLITELKKYYQGVDQEEIVRSQGIEGEAQNLASQCNNDGELALSVLSNLYSVLIEPLFDGMYKYIKENY